MTRRQVLKELQHFIPEVQVIELSLYRDSNKSIGICMTISEIIKSYNSTQENEDKVSALLAQLCKLHFK